MPDSTLDRAAIVAALTGALEPRADVVAMWEGGSVACGRADAYSDLDLSVVVEDDAAAAVWAAIEAALAACSPIEGCWTAPEPAWHGHAQRIYRLRDAGPYLLVDVALMKRSSGDKLVDPEQHGHARVIFDRAGASAPRRFAAAAFRARLRAELGRARATFEMFFTRYTADTLPPDVARELADLYYVRDGDDLLAQRARARALYDAAIAAIDVDAIDLDGLVAAARATS